MDEVDGCFLGIVLAIIFTFLLLFGATIYDSDDIPEQTQYFCSDDGGIIFTRIEHHFWSENDYQFMTDNEFKTYCYNRQIEGNR